MDISSLKVVKAQKRAVNRVIILPFVIMFAILAYLIIANYQQEHNLSWSWASFYILPLIFMVVFDGLLLLSIRKKTNVQQMLSQFSAEELSHIDSQCGEKISLFKSPLIYTDKVVFVATGLNLQAVPLQDLIWLKHQTTTGTIEIVTRQKKTFKIHSQFTAIFFQQFVEKIKTARPFILVSDNQTSGEGKEFNELFKRNFEELVKRSDNGQNAV